MMAHETIQPPRFVVFEGVDGSGKSTFASALTRYYERGGFVETLYSGAFPRSRSGTIGEWVYRFHHGETSDAPAVSEVDPAALQLLHVAAHVDAIVSQIAPVLTGKSSAVILDRYWWSTYAYARLHLSRHHAWALVNAELPFWEGLPAPNIVYLSRDISLKPKEIDQERHTQLSGFYREIISHELDAGTQVIEISNDPPVEQVWKDLLESLKLPYRPLHP